MAFFGFVGSCLFFGVFFSFSCTLLTLSKGPCILEVLWAVPCLYRADRRGLSGVPCYVRNLLRSEDQVFFSATNFALVLSLTFRFFRTFAFPPAFRDVCRVRSAGLFRLSGLACWPVSPLVGFCGCRLSCLRGTVSFWTVGAEPLFWLGSALLPGCFV